jgi:hypothetical protein
MIALQLAHRIDWRLSGSDGLGRPGKCSLFTLQLRQSHIENSVRRQCDPIVPGEESPVPLLAQRKPVVSAREFLIS